jgi:hypothetical protein
MGPTLLFLDLVNRIQEQQISHVRESFEERRQIRLLVTGRRLPGQRGVPLMRLSGDATNEALGL